MNKEAFDKDKEPDITNQKSNELNQFKWQSTFKSYHKSNWFPGKVIGIMGCKRSYFVHDERSSKYREI